MILKSEGKTVAPATAVLTLRGVCSVTAIAQCLHADVPADAAMVVVVRRRVPDNPRATLRGAAKLPNCSLVGVAGFERGEVGVVGRHNGLQRARQIGRAHVCTTATTSQLICR